MCDTHSEQINELAKALAAAQGELEPAEKNSGRKESSSANTLT